MWGCPFLLVAVGLHAGDPVIKGTAFCSMWKVLHGQVQHHSKELSYKAKKERLVPSIGHRICSRPAQTMVQYEYGGRTLMCARSVLKIRKRVGGTGVGQCNGCVVVEMALVNVYDHNATGERKARPNHNIQLRYPNHQYRGVR